MLRDLPCRASGLLEQRVSVDEPAAMLSTLKQGTVHRRLTTERHYVRSCSYLPASAAWHVMRMPTVLRSGPYRLFFLRQQRCRAAARPYRARE
jgi:hypothetical protein